MDRFALTDAGRAYLKAQERRGATTMRVRTIPLRRSCGHIETCRVNLDPYAGNRSHFWNTPCTACAQQAQQ
jgi:hypothetical protein